MIVKPILLTLLHFSSISTFFLHFNYIFFEPSSSYTYGCYYGRCFFILSISDSVRLKDSLNSYIFVIFFIVLGTLS